MTKRIWLLLLSLFAIFWFWVSFANPIAPTLYCNTFKNIEIDEYRVIIEHKGQMKGVVKESERVEPSNIEERTVYEPRINECLKCPYILNFDPSKVYLLDKKIDIRDITQENIDDKAIFIWEIYDYDCSSTYYDRINTYKITSNWNSYNLELSKTINEKIKRKIKNNLKELPYAWLVTIIIETVCIFLIAKFNRKENENPNKKLILSWIVPTTITLPLLRLILPLLEFWGPGEERVIPMLLSYFIWELLVVIIESCIIKYYLKISRSKAIKASVLCNIVSLILWAFILEWLDWLVY